MIAMKFAFIVNSLTPIGGVGRVVLNLAEEFKKRGHESHIYTIKCDQSFVKNYNLGQEAISCYKTLGKLYKLRRVPIIGFLLHILRFILLGIVLLKKVKKENPAIINSHYYFCGISGLILSKILRIPHVLSIHGIKKGKEDMSTLHYWADYLVVEYLKRNVSFFTSVDPSLKSSIRFKEIHEHLEIIYPCLDKQYLESSRNIKPHLEERAELKLLYIGRLEKSKGLESLIIDLARFKGIWGELWVVGEGDFEEELRNLSNKLRIADKVRFFGFLDGMEKIQTINDSDFLVSYSKSEGFPLTILEFFALGKPCIVYPTSPFTNHLNKLNRTGMKFRDEKLGIFLRKENNFLLKALNAPNVSEFFMKEVCDARKHFVKSFYPEKIAGRYLKFFEEIIKLELN